LPEAPKIIGAELKPLSLGHLVALDFFGNGFVSGEVPTYPDLISGVFICSNSWAENRRYLRQQWRAKAILWAWGKLARRFSIPQAVKEFASYIESGNAFPEIKPAKGAKRAHSPWTARVYHFLRSSGFSEAEAMNMPMVAVNVMYCAAAESEERMELLSGDFMEAIRRSQGGGSGGN
jgi:hypothetical protein